MTSRGLLIVFSGPSGVGKDTVLNRFFEADRHDIVLSISATTRNPRPGEEHGRDYFFMSREEFDGLVADGNMLEWAEYSGNCYGTPADMVEQVRASGKHVILEIEMQGARQIKEKCPDGVFVFLMPPSLEVLRSRLEGRGTETPESIEKRMAVAAYEMAKAEEYDYIIVNRSVDQSCVELEEAISLAAAKQHHYQKECQDA